VKPYTVFIHETVMGQLLALRGPRRQRLLRFFEALADNPFQRGEFSVQDVHDREAEVKLVGAFLVTYHADHAVREVQVLELEEL